MDFFGNMELTTLPLTYRVRKCLCHRFNVYTYILKTLELVPNANVIIPHIRKRAKTVSDISKGQMSSTRPVNGDGLVPRPEGLRREAP